METPSRSPVIPATPLGRRTLRRAAAVGASLLLAACVAADADPLEEAARNMNAAEYLQPHHMPAATLTDQHGEPFDLRLDTRNQLTLLFFGYTSCPDICPVTMATISRAMKQLRPNVREHVGVVFVTLDPNRDDTAAIDTWLRSFDPSFVGLTGTQDELDAVLGELGYQMPPTEIPSEGFYEVAHPAAVFLFTPERLGRFAYMPGTSPGQIAQDLETLAAVWWHVDGRSRDALSTGGAGVLVRNAYVLDPGGADRVAVYATIVNEGGEADTLLAVSAETAERGSLHEMSMDGGVMSMAGLDGIVIPAGANTVLEPAARHGMLEGLKKRLAVGDSVEVTFRFARTGHLTASAQVRDPANAHARH